MINQKLLFLQSVEVRFSDLVQGLEKTLQIEIVTVTERGYGC